MSQSTPGRDGLPWRIRRRAATTNGILSYMLPARERSDLPR
jgi:hypothetical protein